MSQKKDDNLEKIKNIKKTVNSISFKNKSSIEKLTDLIQKQAENIRKNKNIISSLLEIQGMYLTNKSKEETFSALLDILLKESDSEYGFIGYIKEDPAGVRYLKTYAITDISWNEETKKFFEDNAPEGLEFRNLNTLFGETIKTGEKVITNDPSNHPKAGGLPPGHPPLKAYLGVPLYQKGKMIGMFGVSNREDGYSKEILKVLKPIIDSVAQLVYAQREEP